MTLTAGLPTIRRFLTKEREQHSEEGAGEEG
jgi:hypothetical protein